ncbi:MAG: hypothetical protein AB7U75_17225 [Hyphomicrobiaceae bacterium]
MATEITSSCEARVQFTSSTTRSRLIVLQRRASLQTLLTSLWILTAFCSPPALAQSEAAAKLASRISIELRKEFGTSEQFDAAITTTYGVQLTPEKAEVARRALRALLSNEALPAYLANLLLPLARLDLTKRQFGAAMLHGIVQLQIQGFSRLPTERQAAFVAHFVAMARSISPSDCKAMFLGQMDTEASTVLERQYIASLPLGKFESITLLYKEAAEAELAGYPDARFINSQQAQIAEKVYEAASVKRLLAQVPKDAIRRVDQDAASAVPSEACAVFTATVEAMLDMTEPYRSWQLSRFTQSMR